jgi:hypothetical protein
VNTIVTPTKGSGLIAHEFAIVDKFRAQEQPCRGSKKEIRLIVCPVRLAGFGRGRPTGDFRFEILKPPLMRFDAQPDVAIHAFLEGRAILRAAKIPRRFTQSRTWQ